MNSRYFNYAHYVARTRRQRRAFQRAWWRLYAPDPRWAPPPYATLTRQLDPEDSLHLARLEPRFLHLEALPRPAHQRVRPGEPALMGAPMFEVPVAAALIWRDPRTAIRGVARTAALGLWRTANDDASCKHFLDIALDLNWRAGVRRLIGPVSLSPYLGDGFLADRWDQTPPLGVPYAPPYQAELAGRHMDLLQETRLWWLRPASADHGPNSGIPTRLYLRPLSGDSLPKRLWPIWASAPPFSAHRPRLDEAEAAYLWRWWAQFPLLGLEAWQGGRPVGFALLQPDMAPSLAASRGGRSAWGRLRWFLGRRARATRGRLLCLVVSPDAGGQGVGRALLSGALRAARDAGWDELAAGPLAADHPGAAFLAQAGATPRETFQLFALDRS